MIIRKQPSDFVVVERTSAAWDAGLLRGEAAAQDAAARHAVFIVKKTSMTTPDAASHLARALGVRVQAVAYAGLKDKHAQTQQVMTVSGWKADTGFDATVKLGKAGDADEAETHAGEHAARALSEAMFAGYASRAIEARDIASNAFFITLRDVERALYERVIARLDLLATGAPQERSVWFLNYFGDQRFGSARHGKGFAGERLFAGDFEGALRLLIATPDRKDTGVQRILTRTLASEWGAWKQLAKSLPRHPNRKAVELLAACGTPTGDDFRKAFAELPYALQELAVDAYQSFLWNTKLAGMAKSMSAAKIEEAMPQQGAGAGKKPKKQKGGGGQGLLKTSVLKTGSTNTPVVATDFGEQVFPAPVPAELLQRSLEMPASDERIPGLRRPAPSRGERACCVLARNVALSVLERDELCKRPKTRGKCVLECELPSGSYVTTLLRALGQ